MQTKITSALLEPTLVNPSAENDQVKINQTKNLNTQVKAIKPKIIRRKFSNSEKLKTVELYDACEDVLARNAFLRKEGLYAASIIKWRRKLCEKNHAGSKAYKLTLAHNQIMRENTALKKRLAQAEAIIDLQKKVSELLSTHVLNPKTSED